MKRNTQDLLYVKKEEEIKLLMNILLGMLGKWREEFTVKKRELI